MKFRTYAILIAAILIATVLAVVLPPEQAMTARMMAVVFSLTTAFSALVTWRKGAEFVLAKPKVVIGVGWAVIGLGMIGFVWGLAAAVRSADAGAATENYVIDSIMVDLVGFLIISAPRITRQSKETRARMEARTAAKAAGKTDSAFNGLLEGEAALQSLAGGWLNFLRMAWPYPLVSCSGMAVVAVATAHGDAAQGVKLGALGVALLAIAMGIPATAVAWHCWLLENRRPKFGVALPDTTTFSYAWRLWFFASLSSRVTDWVGEAVIKMMHQAGLPYADAVGSLTEDVTFAVICAFVSNQALRMPAVAVRDQAFTQSLAMMEGRKMWPQLAIGLVVSIAPFLLLRMLLNAIILLKQQPGWMFALTAAVQFALMFLAYAAAATFLSRGYLETKARLANI